MVCITEPESQIMRRITYTAPASAYIETISTETLNGKKITKVVGKNLDRIKKVVYNTETFEILSQSSTEMLIQSIPASLKGKELMFLTEWHTIRKTL